MRHDWSRLTEMTKDKDLLVKMVEVQGEGLQIEGEFELPPLAKLTMEDQVFVAAFVKSHGSIKEMEKLFGISYPTVKSRLNKLAEKFGFIQIEEKESKSEILAKIERGEISPEEAVELLK